jgi:phenylacetate-CoA ligase
MRTMPWHPLRQAWQLHRQQWLPDARLRELRNARLRSLVRHAYASVPYYRRLFDARGLRPEAITTVEDLPKVPILTRAELSQGDPSDFLASGVDRGHCATSRTGGSTGRWLTLYHTTREKTVSDLSYVRSHLANGVRPWHRQVTFSPDFRMRARKHWIDRWRGPRKRALSASRDMREHVEVVRAFRPHVLAGPTQVLKSLARIVRERRIQDIRPRIVIGSSTVLDSATRAFIDGTFGVRMVDEYATAEAGCIAWECPAHAGYHLSADTVIVELDRDGKPARPHEAARVIVTPLFRRTMPLLRYDQGDVGVAATGRCPCGRTLPLMRAIEGRVGALFTLPSGTVLYPAPMMRVLMHAERSVSEFRLVQEARDSVVMQLVVRGGHDPEAVRRVQRGLEELVRHEATVRVEVVDRIDRSADKYEAIVSKVPVTF